MELNSIGSFAAFVRRPIPKAGGFVANFFGENGDDADIVSVLSLTKYQDRDVYINVYWIKNADGEDMSESSPDGKYPKITSFGGKINRPLPNKDGMLAQFFAHDGENADAVNILGNSVYVDSLVYVDILGETKTGVNIYDGYEEKTQQHILTTHAHKVVESVKKDYLKKSKTYEKINNILHQSSFLEKKEVLDVINKTSNYQDYIKKQKCVCQNCENIGNNVVKLSKQPYSEVPVCDEHYDLVFNAVQSGNYEQIAGREYHLEMVALRLNRRYVFQHFIDNFSLTGKEEPDSLKILTWAAENKINQFLPEDFIKKSVKLDK